MLLILTTNLDLTTENRGTLTRIQRMFERDRTVPSKGDLIQLGKGVKVEVKEVKWEIVNNTEHVACSTRHSGAVSNIQATVYVGTPGGMTIAEFQENQENQRYSYKNVQK